MLHPEIFREYDIRGTYEKTLLDEDAFAIGRAFGAALETMPGPVFLGQDGRASSPSLAACMSEGLRAAGRDVVRIGIGPTPMLYFATSAHQGAGGVMITGSHNPPDQNGFKFMRGAKPFYGPEIQNLRALALSPAKQAAAGTETGRDVRAEYLQALLAGYDAGAARPLRVAWDAGNGAAGEVMAALAARLPGEHVLLNERIDGTFPAHHPDPSVPENLAQLIAAVRANGCDLGIAFDGDGDRVGAVDGEGNILSGDHLMMLYARDVLASRPGSTIIADVKASQTLFDDIAQAGGVPLMWKTGHSHVKAKLAETGAALAGEMSGHIFFADRYYGFDDALYAAVRLLSLVARAEMPLASLTRTLPRLSSTPEWRFPCDESRKFKVIDEVRDRLAGAGAEFSAIDGVRVRAAPDGPGQGGWWLLRASNTQAMLVARAEAPTEAALSALTADLRAQLAASNVSLPF